INGFGTFALSYYPARKGRNPQTGEEIEIEGANKPVFKPAKALKDAL
ncbi:MAG TPA: HU family DNA-binding protein, partial [Pseudoalteromonas sp.]|nr:HU family DNA-binding protein [Pseudoalteromonas sp.]